MKTISLRASFFTFLAVAIPLSSSAQASSPDAHLSGTLFDPNGAGIAGVRITAQLETVPNAPVLAAISSSDGAYTLDLPAGRYHIQFTRPSFVPRDFTLELSAGESRNLDLRLGLERLSSSVVVSAQAEPALAQETSASVSVITREEIERRQAVPLTDVLLYSSGVAIDRTGPEGGFAGIFLNGGNSYQTKVLVDGTAVNLPGGTFDFSNFTLDNIDKVEVVRGAESALYGTDAVSGVIQVFTHRGETRVPAVNLFTEGGSFSTARGGAQLSGLLGSFDYSGAASYFTSDGQGPNNSFRNRTVSGNFGYAFSETNQLRLALRNNTSEAGIPGQTLITPPSLHQINDLHDFSANARWDFTSGAHWHHQVSSAESYHHMFTANPIQSFFATDPFAGCPRTDPAAVPTAEFCDFTSAGAKSEYNRASINAQTSYILRKISATAGYQYEVENADISFLGIGHLRRNNQGGYLDLRYLPHRRVSLDFGARAEANGSFGTRVVPRVGASLGLRYGSGFWGDTRYRFFYGEGIVEPRFDQNAGFSPCFPGNPSLKPEASKTWNTGIEQKLADDRVKISADYFSSRFYDIISFTSCFPFSPCAIPQPAGCPAFWGNFFNTDLARARGTNIAVETRLVRWLMLAGNYSYDDSRVLVSPNAFDLAEIAGNHLIRRPTHSGSLTLSSSFRQFNFIIAGYFSGARTDSDFLFLGLTRNPGYARFDISSSYAMGRGISLYARATNLFDKHYQDAIGYPSLGRDVRVGMNYRFSGKN
ncbi:MAG TPA: TonB-dependent receptor [Candidatus Acidoferrum sp.]|nr:TonB-dependent receptor [Candidatus Acidoferrum sp.]